MKQFLLPLLVIWLISWQGSLAQDRPREIVTVNGRKIRSGDLDTLIKKAMDSLGIPGVSMAIINDAELVYHYAGGVTNLETKEPVDNETIFEAASLSKPLFAYFAMTMSEKGVIELDKPLYQYLPHPAIKDNDERYKLITARMVLSHATGFPNWAHDKPIELQFTPGTGFSYSGEAYQYLAAIIAIRHNTNWREGLDSIFQVEVASPLGLKNATFMEGDHYVLSHKARGHKDGSVTQEGRPGKSFGAGYSLHTEAKDYATFLIALMKGKGLQKKTMDEMLKEQNHFAEDNDLLETGQTGWCLGFSMKPTTHGIRYLHTGNNHDFQSYCAFYKEKKYGFVLFTNCNKAFELYTVIGKFLSDEF